MLEQYLPVLIFMVVALGLASVVVSLGLFLGPKVPNKAKKSPYECGFDIFEDTRIPFDVRYYLVAILFIVFDLEIAFLFPWAVALKTLSGAAFLAMAMFIAILLVGFVYEWKKGALEWE